MTSIRPILDKAEIIFEVSFYDHLEPEEIKDICNQIIVAGGSRASSSHRHLSWIARANTEILIEAGHNHTREYLEEEGQDD